MFSGLRSKYKAQKQKQFYRTLISANNIKYVFDIGANIGKKSELFLEAGCEVLAMEPNPACYKKLEELKKKYSGLRTECLALSDSQKMLTLHLGNHPEISTLSEKMIKEFTYKKEVYWDKTETVQAVAFDDMVSKYFYPEFLKLDCEGWDHVIILSLKKPVELIEFEFTDKFCDECTAAIKHLSAFGNYVFNFSPYEQSKFAFSEWLEADELIKQLNIMKKTIIHGNIYAIFTKAEF